MNYEKPSLTEQTITIGVNWYRVSTLVAFVAEQKLKAFSAWGDAFDLSIDVWTDLESLEDFKIHMIRINAADLSFPVILSPEGKILDGFHRIIKASIQGIAVKCVRLREMPTPDGTNEEEA